MSDKEVPEQVSSIEKEKWDEIETSGSTTPEWTLEDEKRIRNRMDWRIVPTVFVLYLLCFIDRYGRSTSLIHREAC